MQHINCKVTSSTLDVLVMCEVEIFKLASRSRQHSFVRLTTELFQ